MNTLYYVHDPMCSWCWGFTKTWYQLQSVLPENIQVIRLLGGLAPDTDAPMPNETKQMVIGNWQRIEQHIAGIKFNFDFWDKNEPRRSTYPACRAVIAARQQGKEFDLAMTQAIQTAYYQQARNPSNDSTLIELADELKLDKEVFSHALQDPKTHETLINEIKQSRGMNADSFPGLVLECKDRFEHIFIDYNHYQPMLESISALIKENT